jgi:hypothetical protein
MNYRTLFVINAFVAFLFGVAFLFVPTLAMKQFGVDNYASTRMLAEFFGTAMLALALVLWFAKDITDESVLRGMGVALLLGDLAGLVVSVLGTVGGTLRTNGWMIMVLYALFGLGFAYLVFLRPRMKE